ncbi:putative GTP diphosphokinase RSH1, chloroplastic isoform X1 [Selaginella moellendorffii]|uniref:putative GTP diphosphokinase RSH1, chloroplastic isoform X1 n=1 Tax=Selaginella moellendorffii TaxID=88036 RepID=UPI000D1CCDE6|nr:putative GTP diphosphokinase RSH1, chloroplastic isoform X1 [Selaginella moellendorffii]|eukprot:XP_002976143.2 putative GTP diphosphokinase RSH1, chloroplastic isoform X1 [Selaginella moellendorffii]
MACAAHYPALVEAAPSCRRCCCTISAWIAPRQLTGNLANTADSHLQTEIKSRRGFLRTAAILKKSYAYKRLRSCRVHNGSDTSEEYGFSSLWDKLRTSISYLSQGELNRVKEALKLAFDAHDGQKRRSGEPYIIHPVEVGRILGELEMDWETIAAGLLHDTVEDTDFVTFEKLEEEFGFNVRRIVEGETKVSKLGKIQFSDSQAAVQDAQADDLRQMFLAMTEEVRVIVVKLADRLHNMRTLSFMPEHKQRHIALETLQVFAPLARLLGIHKIKSELEELSFMYAYPADYIDMKKKVEKHFKSQSDLILQAKNALVKSVQSDQFLSHVIDGVNIFTLCKDLYSIYKKKKNLEEAGDVAQVRIVLQPKPDSIDRLCSAKQVCYHVLGLVHTLWSPVPQTMKDYIATPKPNGYQSLHTKVIPFGSKTFFPLEIQIRTDKMDKIAQYGIAVHFSGSIALTPAINGSRQQSNCLNAADLARRVSWLNSIRQWQEEFVGNMTSREFVDTVTVDLLGSRVFVFTPKGEIKNLPRGATVVDYAYQLHADVGNKMVGAKVNGNLVSPTHVLSNAEVVEILTYEGLSNKKQFLRHKRWLHFARTRSARHKLTKFLKEQALLSAIELTADAVKKFLSNSEELTSGEGHPVTDEDRDRDRAMASFSGHFSMNDLATSNPYAAKLLPVQDAMMYGGRMINGKHAKRGELAGKLGRGTCVIGSAASDSQRTYTYINNVTDASRSREDWLIGRLKNWQCLGSSVQWFSICCMDRRNILAEVTGALGGAGILICACVAETDGVKGLGTMLFHIEGSTDNLWEACSSMDMIDGILNWSIGCCWQPPDTRQRIDLQYNA